MPLYEFECKKCRNNILAARDTIEKKFDKKILTSILKKYVNLENTKNETENRLEQLRALDNNITINVALAKSSPIGVDTKEDYLALKKIMEYKS